MKVIYSQELQHVRRPYGSLRNAPVVALESTIIAHGMPYPQNLETALRLEQIVRNAGAYPATIAIIQGEIRIGLEMHELELLAKTGGKDFGKVSRRDLAVCIKRKQNGATTVSSTLIVCRMAGIRVFVTGGLGGIHRHVEKSWDISADLAELSHGDQLVVCSGIKSILDVPKTLEALESLGVPVFAWKQSRFPMFYTRDSGINAPFEMHSASEAAEIILQNSALRESKSSMVLGVPVPEQYEADARRIQDAIERALDEADRQRIQGAKITPFVLKRVAELTQNESLQTNMHLVFHNAQVGAEIASHLVSLFPRSAFPSTRVRWSHSEPHLPRVAVFGGMAIDMTCFVKHPKILMNSSNPGTMRTSFGGVGRNLAEGLGKLGACQVFMVSAVGGEQAPPRSHLIKPSLMTDPETQGMISSLQSLQVNTDFVVVCEEQSTARYIAIHGGADQDLVVAVAAMDIFDSKPLHALFQNEGTGLGSLLDTLDGIVMDANFSIEESQQILNRARDQKNKKKKRQTIVIGQPFLQPPLLFYEPTSTAKADKIVQAQGLDAVDVMFPNTTEMIAIAMQINVSLSQESHRLEAVQAILSQGVRMIVETRGSLGVSVHRLCPQTGNVVTNDYPPLKPIALSEIRSSSGAGDTLAAAFISLMMKHMNTVVNKYDSALEKLMVYTAMRCAEKSLYSRFAIPDDLGVQDLELAFPLPAHAKL